MRSKALIFGISGQDGSLLADFLLKKNYRILGITRNKNAKKFNKKTTFNCYIAWR